MTDPRQWTAPGGNYTGPHSTYQHSAPANAQQHYPGSTSADYKGSGYQQGHSSSSSSGQHSERRRSRSPRGRRHSRSPSPNDRKRHGGRHGSRSRSPSRSPSPSWRQNQPPALEPKSLLLIGFDDSVTEEKISDRLKVFGPVERVYFLTTGGDKKAVARFATSHEATLMLHYLTNPSSPFMVDDKLIRVELYRGDVPSTDSSYNRGDRRDHVDRDRGDRRDRNDRGDARHHKQRDGENQPNRIIMVRNLPFNYQDGMLEQAITAAGCGIQPLNIRVPRDKFSGTSRGFGFMEFPDVAMASEFLKITRASVPCGGINCRFHFATEGYQNPTHAASQIMPANWNNTVFGGGGGAAPQQGYAQQYTGYPAQTQPQVQWPPGSDFRYDPTTGYYKDTSTNFYYDPYSGYYFETSTQTYYYFDHEKAIFVVASAAKPDTTGGATPGAAASALHATSVNTNTAAPTSAEPEAKKPISISFGTKAKSGPSKDKKMSQQLARWNQKHSELDESDFQPHTAAPEKKAKAPAPPKPEQAASEPAAAGGGWVEVSSTSAPAQPAPAPAAPQVEITRGLLCLICKRQFKTQEMVDKHCQESKLHQDNLAALKASNPAALPPVQHPTTPTDEIPEYRKDQLLLYQENKSAPSATKRKRPDDEQSDLYDPSASYKAVKSYEDQTPRPPVPSGQFYTPPPSAPAAPAPLISSNIGAKLMAQMGWKGGGLGKNEDGIVDPIKAAQQAERSGLGNQSDAYERINIIPGVTTYVDAVKMRARQRYERLTNNPS